MVLSTTGPPVDAPMSPANHYEGWAQDPAACSKANTGGASTADGYSRAPTVRAGLLDSDPGEDVVDAEGGSVAEFAWLRLLAVGCFDVNRRCAVLGTERKPRAVG